jgi:putative transposase
MQRMSGPRLRNLVIGRRQPFRRRERAELRFRLMRTLQIFVAVRASVHTYFNAERHLSSRSNFKLNRAAALADWRKLCSAKVPAIGGPLKLVRIRLSAPSG